METKTPSRSEKEAAIKDKSGWVITLLAALLAVNTYVANTHSSKVLTNTIKANDTWSFYQAKSIKQAIAEGQRDDYLSRGQQAKADALQKKIDRYESDPDSGEGKKELLARAQSLEAERDDARRHGPWLTFSGMAFQLAIVLLSAAILAVSQRLYYGSIAVGIAATALMTQGIMLWF